MQKLRISLILIHAFVGLGALGGGYLGLSDPTLASMGAEAAEMLKHGPFDSFFVPGLFLFVVLGLFNLTAAYTAARKWKNQSYYSGIMGIILMAWIFIQCYMLWDINALHIIFFLIGAIQALAALIMLIHKKELRS